MAKKNTQEPTIEQPSIDIQQLYLELISNDAEEVEILRTKKKYKIRWLKNGQLEKLTRLLLHKRTVGEKMTTGSEVLDAVLEDCKLTCKAAAIIILDGYWKLKLRYWFLWRWFYYIRQYDDMQLIKILEVGKKKVPLKQFYATITSLTEAKDTLMRMTTKEVEVILQGQNMEARSQTGSKDSGS